MNNAGGQATSRSRAASGAIAVVPLLAIATLFLWPTIRFQTLDRRMEKTINERLSGSSSVFDPVNDRAIVVDCVAAYLSVADIGYERLKLPTNQVKAADQAAYRDFQQWKPLVRAAQQRTSANLYEQAGAGPGFWRSKAADLQAWMPGGKGHAFGAMISRTLQCNRLAARWTQRPDA